MSTQRDPRIDPLPGDQIRQYGNGYVLRVTSVRDGLVSWQRYKMGSWVDDNQWSLDGWRNVVAKNATIKCVVDGQPADAGEL